jgi:hypothetical protein
MEILVTELKEMRHQSTASFTTNAAFSLLSAQSLPPGSGAPQWT